MHLSLYTYQEEVVLCCIQTHYFHQYMCSDINLREGLRMQLGQLRQPVPQLTRMGEGEGDLSNISIVQKT